MEQRMTDGHSGAGTPVVGWEVVERRLGPEQDEETVHLRVVTSDPTLAADDVPIVGRYHRSIASTGASGTPGQAAQRAGIVWVGGTGGGVDGPNAMYPRLARRLADEGIVSLRLGYRRPLEIEPSLVDCLVGVGFLREEGVGKLGLVGHSAGGAVVITVGALIENVATVVALATQAWGTDLAGQLDPASLLLVHGLEDPVLPCACSLDVGRRSDARTKLQLIPDAGHSFEPHEGEVSALVLDSLRRELAAGGPA
jgi:hypothetical protein